MQETRPNLTTPIRRTAQQPPLARYSDPRLDSNQGRLWDKGARLDHAISNYRRARRAAFWHRAEGAVDGNRSRAAASKVASDFYCCRRALHSGVLLQVFLRGP